MQMMVNIVQNVLPVPQILLLNAFTAQAVFRNPTHPCHYYGTVDVHSVL